MRLQRHQRRRPAIDQQGGLGGLQKETGVEPAAGAEGIAGTDDRQAHAQADALGRAETSACQRLRLTSSSGTASFAGFIKSTETSPVMSATVKISPVTKRRSFSSRSSTWRKSMMRGLLASAHAVTCGTSIAFIAGWQTGKTVENGTSKGKH